MLHQPIPEPIPEPKPEPKPEKEISEEDDPFEGIETKDINKYVDLYDQDTPETHKEALQLAEKIRTWISNGRPKPGEESKTQVEKKKHSFFGRFKK